MKYIKMSYRGVEFPVSVSSIQAEFAKKISRTSILKRNTRVEEICTEPAVISGAGCFLGEEGEHEAHRLMTAFQHRGAAYLFSPIFAPMRMHFSELKISAGAEKGRIDFQFQFIEESKGKKRSHDFGYTIALDGENLYDIANRCGIGVEEIFEANSYRDLFSVEKGDRVWLR